ncbi:MAG: hypothetical protein ACRC0V_02780, partial [Fusobacteriaceae bacterium]
MKRGINFQQAAIIIGKHFSDVQDKLINYIQLLESKSQSDLLLASIEQKTDSLKFVPFGYAIHLQTNKKYLPFAFIPFLVFILFYTTGNNTVISQSFNRVVHFYSPFTKPAPFKFIIENPSLQTTENTDFVLKLKLVGSVIPENVTIFVGDESYFMETVEAGAFEYKFTNLAESSTFYFKANAFYSDNYALDVVKVPTIIDFDMSLVFPSYLRMNTKTIKGNGNAIIPEGTKINWKIKARTTASILFQDSLASSSFVKSEDYFTLSKSIFNNIKYKIITSNSKETNHQTLDYKISIIKDQYPSIEVTKLPDSIDASKNFLLGKVSDDYGISKLTINYYNVERPQEVSTVSIIISADKFNRFVYSFPGDINITEGISYEYFFEVFDNDELHNFKSTKSDLFSTYIPTETEVQDKNFEQQNSNIENMENVLKSQQSQMNSLEQLKKNQLLKN